MIALEVRAEVAADLVVSGESVVIEDVRQHLHDFKLVGYRGIHPVLPLMVLVVADNHAPEEFLEVFQLFALEADAVLDV